MKIFIGLKWFFKKEKKSYFIGILSLGAVAFLNLLSPKIMGDIVDNINKQTLTKTALIYNLVSLILIAVAIYLSRYIWRIFIFGASFRLERSLRQSLFEHFTKMSSTFFHEHRTGDLMAHATNDLKAIQRVAGGGILMLADALITGISTLLAMALFVNWKLTLIAIVPMPLMIIGSQYLSKKIHNAFIKAQEAFSSLNDRTHESVNGIKVVKTFGQEKEEIEVFKNQTEDVYKKNMLVSYFDAAFDPMITIVFLLSFIFVIIASSYFIKNGEMTLGNLTTFISYTYILIWPMLAFGFLYNIIERGNVSYDRIKVLMDIKADINNIEKPIKVIPNGNIKVNIKSFNYPNNQEVKLQNINFELLKGETLGLVGKTGSGKTTLIKLLLRDYDNYKGNIQLDNEDIKNYEISHLHQSIGYVPQDQFLFSASIMDNIRFGKMEAKMEDVIKVAKIACVHDDIMGFANQYETMVGERGISLSGGQKQRIAIARALLLNPELLILDDSLSAVDAKTEEAILTTLKETRKDKTTIIAAHRLSAIKHSQEILVLEDGHIIERGKHQELIESKGWYSTIFNKQEFSKEEN